MRIRYSIRADSRLLSCRVPRGPVSSLFSGSRLMLEQAAEGLCLKFPGRLVRARILASSYPAA